MDTDRKTALHAWRKDLQDRLERYHAHQTRADEPLPADFAEQNLTRLNDEVVDSLETQLRGEIARIDHALQRIDAGVGDVCEKCGGSINGARLEALPYSTLCMQCAQ